MSTSGSDFHLKMFHLIKLGPWFGLTQVQVYAWTQTEKYLFLDYKWAYHLYFKCMTCLS